MNIVKNALETMMVFVAALIIQFCMTSPAIAGDSGDYLEGIPTVTLRYPDREKTYEQCIKQQGRPCSNNSSVTIAITDLGKFHGDVCPGISFGYRACQTALARLYPGDIPPRGDQFVVSGAERRCPADAITYVTGNRYGKGTNGVLDGNFVFDKSLGEFSFIFASMSSGKAVKLKNRFPLSKEFMDLKEKVRLPEATEEEKEKFSHMSRCLSRYILTAPEKEIFEVVPLTNFSWDEYKEKEPKN